MSTRLGDRARAPIKNTIKPLLGGGESPLWHAFLAVLVGAVAGVGALVFRVLIAIVHNGLFYGVFSIHYNANVHSSASPWGAGIVLVPVVGAVVVAFVVKHFAPEAKGHGVPEVMDAIYYKRGVIRPAVAAVKALASSISIGSGGSVGREGPIVQIGAAFGSTLGQLLPLAEWQRMTLIACGAGGGIAATFNTPIGGVLFAVELILPEISARTLIPVLISTGSATFISRLVFGINPAFNIPALATYGSTVTDPRALAIYAVLGVVLGVASILFIRALYGFEDLFDRMPGNYYSRHIIGMAAIGAMFYLLMYFTGHYYVEGVGYATVQDVLSGGLALPLFLFVLMLLKILATSVTIGSGASGGVFSPSLFIGATLGASYAGLINFIWPGLHIDPAAMGVVGMGGLVGGATGAVVTGIVMIFEMTRDYHVIIPLMLAGSIAYGIRRIYMDASIYDLKLVRRGHYIPKALQTNLYLMHTVGELISTPILRIGRRPNLRRLQSILRRSKRPPHVVVVSRGRIDGVIVADKARRMDLSHGIEPALADYGETRYLVVSADEAVFDIVTRLRDALADIALVTDNGELHAPEEILGVLTWADVASGSVLPRPLLERKRRRQRD
jgi:CIC family chloride channel protein